MKLTLITLFIFTTGLLASIHSQNVRVNIHVNNAKTLQILEEIERQTDFLFIYNKKEVDLDRKVSINAKDQTVADVLSSIFTQTDISYEMEGSNIMLMRKSALMNVNQQNTRKISGVVKDKSGEPIIGGNIIVKGSTNGTVTDLDGKFSIDVNNNSILQISYIGYNTIDVPVANKTTLSIKLSEDTQILGEVVVTALGIKTSEKAIGYSVQRLGGDKLTTVKGAEVGTSLSGKIAGLTVYNSTEFAEAPKLYLRGSEPLIVMDGIPYRGLSLKDISADDIESIDFLKGATASALYGNRGAIGCVMITTKQAKEDGLTVDVNSSTMFQGGYLMFPETQSRYSNGMDGRYSVGTYVWGDIMDAGRMYEQYNPETYKMELRELKCVGENNFKNFLRTSFVTNNNVAIAYKGKHGSIRSSLTHVYNRGQYENNDFNKITYQVIGDIKYNKFDFQGGVTLNHRFYPTDYGLGYNSGGYLYNLVIYGGKEYNLMDYRNYWKIKDQEQNWFENEWLANPWLIANEVLHSNNYTKMNGFLSMGYQITPWLKASVRSGLDFYSSNYKWKTPKGLPIQVGEAGGKGLFAVQEGHGMSVNADAMLNAQKTFNKFSIDALLGASIYYYTDESMKAYTVGGLRIPGFYSLSNSVERPDSWWNLGQRQTNSIYGKLSFSYRNLVFLDLTGRNDWDSTLPEQTRSFFYPSMSASVILSDIIPKISWLDLWKLRGAWTISKSNWGIYSVNQTYWHNSDAWGGLPSAGYPGTIAKQVPKPKTLSAWEIGTDINIFKNRLWTSLAFFNNKNYNSAVWAPVSLGTGFNDIRINSKTEYIQKGFEISVGGRPIQTNNFEWDIQANWSKDHTYFGDLDPEYDPETPYRKKGKRADQLLIRDWERDTQGNIIHKNGLPVRSEYVSHMGYLDADWVLGITNTFNYKDFTLSFSIDGRVGGKMYSFTNQALWNTGSHRDSDNKWRYDEVVNGKHNYIGSGVKVVSGEVERDQWGFITKDSRVFAPNDVEVGYQQYTRDYHWFAGNPCPQNYLDQTFFKLRNLSISYEVPREWCGKLGMRKASVSLIGQNLFIWTKDFEHADPDKNYSARGWSEEFLSSPSCRLYGFNIKVNF